MKKQFMWEFVDEKYLSSFLNERAMFEDELYVLSPCWGYLELVILSASFTASYTFMTFPVLESFLKRTFFMALFDLL